MITREFINDLKKSDSVVLRINRTSNFESTAELELIVREKKNNNGWVKPEERKIHNSIKANLPRKFNEALYVSLFKGCHDGFEALQYILRPGDELTVSGTINNNGYLDKALIPIDAWKEEEALYHTTYNNLYHEQLTVRIRRKDKIIIDSMIIASQISVDNSSRMLR